jgi:hypothetical protein
MVQRPRVTPEDATGDEEATELEGAPTDHRVRVVTASESASGAVGFDDRGQPHWKWVTELGPSAGDVSGTFDQLKALDNPALSLEEEAPAAAPAEPPRKVGYDPYATQGANKKPKVRR